MYDHIRIANYLLDLFAALIKRALFDRSKDPECVAHIAKATTCKRL